MNRPVLLGHADSQDFTAAWRSAEAECAGDLMAHALTDDYDLPLTRLHVWILVVSVTALGFDLGEMALGAALSAVFAQQGFAGSGELGWLLAAVFVGGAVGAWPAGRLADRFGRRPVIVALLALLAAASLAGAASPDIVWLTWARGVSGLALGVLPVLIVAYLTDTLPTRGRAPLILAASALGLAGGPLLLILLRGLSPLQPLGFEGWRWALCVGGVGSLIAAILFRGLPEAPRWLAKTGRGDQSERVRQSLLASGLALRTSLVGRDARSVDRSPPAGAERPRLALIGSLCLLSPWVGMSFPVLSGAVLTQRGFVLDDSLFYLALSSTGLVVGTLAAARVIDRVERPAALAASAVGMVVGLSIFCTGQGGWAIVGGNFVFQMFAAIQVVTLNIWAAELFDVERRATLTASAWAIQRMSAAVALLFLAPLLMAQGALAVLLLLVALLLTIAGLVWVFGPRSLAVGISEGEPR